jgi:histidinol dehydrogenase
MRIRTQPWDGSDPARLAASLRATAPEPEGISDAVAAVIESVREQGDAAVAEHSARFDGVAADPLEVPAERLAAAVTAIPPALREAIEVAAANVRAVAAAQIGEPVALRLGAGQRVEVAEVAVGAAGIYVPGGRAPYPSSAVMGVVPARVAGVGRVVVASPPDPATGVPADPVLAAAKIAGADAVYAVGGAQAIAALAHGTESVPAVDVIAGPGSPWVQEAKLQCSRRVGTDGYAGPSELVVIALEDVPWEWVALDLCAQAEHGGDGLLVAIADDAGRLERLAEAVESVRARREEAGGPVVELVLVDGADAAVALTDALAPEHAEVMAPDAATLAARLTTAGCVFVGPTSATAFGDYAAGSNHVLPTGGAGRFSGPLGPGTFRRRIARVEVDAEAAAVLAPTVDTIARAEGFPLHGESAVARAGGRNDLGKGE